MDRSKSLTANSAGQKDIAAHESDSVGVIGTEIGIFKERDNSCFGGFLQCQERITLESELSLKVEILHNLTD